MVTAPGSPMWHRPMSLAGSRSPLRPAQPGQVPGPVSQSSSILPVSLSSSIFLHPGRALCPGWLSNDGDGISSQWSVLDTSPLSQIRDTSQPSLSRVSTLGTNIAHMSQKIWTPHIYFTMGVCSPQLIPIFVTAKTRHMPVNIGQPSNIISQTTVCTSVLPVSYLNFPNIISHHLPHHRCWV